MRFRLSSSAASAVPHSSGVASTPAAAPDTRFSRLPAVSPAGERTNVIAASVLAPVGMVCRDAVFERPTDVFDPPNVDLQRVGQSHVLLVGPRPNALLDAIRSALRQPVVECVVDDPASLPREGTVILRHVEWLDERRQRDLSRWMESSPARVVATCDDTLYARVIAGSFCATLYYRLNTLTLVAAATGSPAGV